MAEPTNLDPWSLNCLITPDDIITISVSFCNYFQGTTLTILNLKCHQIGMTFSYSKQIVSSAIPDDFEAVGARCLGMNQPVWPNKLLEPVLPPAVDCSYLHGSDRSIESRRLKIEENDVGLHVTRGHSCFRFPQKGLKFISNGNSITFRYIYFR